VSIEDYILYQKSLNADYISIKALVPLDPLISLVLPVPLQSKHSLLNQFYNHTWIKLKDFDFVLMLVLYIEFLDSNHCCLSKDLPSYVKNHRNPVT
jgi:hypothetical protein